MEISGNLWKPLEIYGNLWKSMEIYRNVWKSVEICGNLCNDPGLPGPMRTLVGKSAVLKKTYKRDLQVFPGWPKSNRLVPGAVSKPKAIEI